MKMAGYTIFAFFGLAAQGSAVDSSASVSLFEALHGKSLSLPSFASFFQKRFADKEGDEHGNSKHDTWRKQASVYMGLLQSLGAAVPKEKEAQTVEYINQIIYLLKSPAQQIYDEAGNTSVDLGRKIYESYGNLSAADKKAGGMYGTAEDSNEKLKVCYHELHAIEDDKFGHCGDRATPSSCYRMNATRKHTFKVASKRPWNCSFAYGSSVEKCAGDSSQLYHELTDAKDSMQLAMAQWKIEKATCDAALKTQYDECHNTSSQLVDKRAECKEALITAEEFMCNWREWIQKRIDAGADLDDLQSKLPYLLPGMKKEWMDLNIIICMLETFRDRAGGYSEMTFKEEDYSNCEKKVYGMKWVGAVDGMEKEEAELLKASMFNNATLHVFFKGGLAEYYIAQYFIESMFTYYIPAADRPDYEQMSVALFATPKPQMSSTLFAEIPEKKLPTSCKGYKTIAGQEECSEDNTCKFYDTDTSGASHSVSSTCLLDKADAGATAMKVCVAGLRATSIIF